MSPRALHLVLDELAHRIARLDDNRRNPETYHVEKSAIAGELRAAARLLKSGAVIEPSPVFHRTPADADPRLRRRDVALAATFFRINHQ
jgi:hypothetical protein